ncbi:Nitrogen fixation protein FixH [Roseibium suaedae]|uniref:Nitrogen fixation protein FixH n=2 Tax=Roseibium suaedae TaxID=735517 RepID=A0A1M7BNZ0_9HYPH|nr:Nitrogen fixation protein FixH [Roseibium suaedae]
METMTQTVSGTKPARELTGRGVLMWLLGFFGLVFAANGVFIYYALGTFPGVVVESSYKAGQEYNQTIAAATAQSERGWKVGVDLTRGLTGSGDVRVEARDKTGAPLTGLAFTATLKHPVYQGQDLTVDLGETESGVYTGKLDALPAGNWQLEVVAMQNGERIFLSENRVFLNE